MCMAPSAKDSPGPKISTTTSAPSGRRRNSFTQPERTTKKWVAGSPCRNRVLRLPCIRTAQSPSRSVRLSADRPVKRGRACRRAISWALRFMGARSGCRISAPACHKSPPFRDHAVVAGFQRRRSVLWVSAGTRTIHRAIHRAKRRTLPHDGQTAHTGTDRARRGHARPFARTGRSRRIHRHDPRHGGDLLPAARPAPGQPAAGQISAHAGPFPDRRGRPAARLVRQIDHRGQQARQAARQDRGDQGQYLRRRPADDERRLGAGGLCAGGRRHGGDPHAGRRRHDSRQGPLRVFLLFRQQPYQRPEDDAQPAESGIHAGRFVLRLRGAAGGRRGRSRHRQRPGRLDPRAGGVQRPCRHEADLGPGALYRRGVDRDDARPSRPDEPDRRGQCALSGGAGRGRRTGPAPVCAAHRALYPGAGPTRRGPAHRRHAGGLRFRGQRGGCRRGRARRGGGLRLAGCGGHGHFRAGPSRARHAGLGADRLRGRL